jgi:2-iminoacetate synthase
MATDRGGFGRYLDDLDLSGLVGDAASADDRDVDRALTARRPGLDDLAVLLSPAATERVEDLARRARELTLQRFGRAIRLFAPLYVSNACLSTCAYCGFSKDLLVNRRTLLPREVVKEAELLRDRGFRSILLVSGEHRVEVSPEYLIECVARVGQVVPQVSLETQTWDEPVYERLVNAGIEGVVHYQETYDRDRYAEVHLRGWKRDFDRRLNAIESAAVAGVRRIGLGALLGLAPDWKADVIGLVAHGSWLQQHAWRAELTTSLPRLKPSAAGFPPQSVVSDREYVQALAAVRILLPEAGIVLSTREPVALRDGLLRVCVTTMSAGSSTEPGGYGSPGEAQEQFAISDERSPAEVSAAIAGAGYEPVWLDGFALAATAEVGSGQRRA